MSGKTRMLVTGASGFIGKEFLKVLSGHAVTGTGFSRSGPALVRLDLREREPVQAMLRDLRPEVVIHCAARPSVDWCEIYPDEAGAINLAPLMTLAQECDRLGSKLVFLSTDYVFDGSRGPYCETDAPNPINVYGRLKLEGEGLIRRQNDNHLIVRTTNVYGFDPESKNFLMAVLPELASGKRVRAAIDQIGNPTTVEDLCSVVAELIIKECTGTFHVTGPDLVSRAEWLRKAACAFGVDPEFVSGVPTGELSQPAPRPKKSGLVSRYLDSVVARRLLDLENGLVRMRKEWDEHQPQRAAALALREGALNA